MSTIVDFRSMLGWLITRLAVLVGTPGFPSFRRKPESRHLIPRDAGRKISEDLDSCFRSNDAEGLLPEPQKIPLTLVCAMDWGTVILLQDAKADQALPLFFSGDLPCRFSDEPAVNLSSQPVCMNHR